jgi:hypothetical protein
VNEFAGMDFYPADIEAAGQLVRIANANGERVLAAI